MSTPPATELASPDEIRQLRARVAELEREQRTCQQIIERAPVMISVVRGPDFVYEFVNPAFQALAPGKEFIGRRFADVWAEVSDPLVEILQNVANTGETFHLDDAPYTIQRMPDGPPELVYATYSCVPVAGPDGKPDRIVTLARETTDSVRRRQAEQTRETDRQLLETLLANLPAGAALIRGSDLRVILVNPAYQANAPGREIVGKTVEEAWPEYHPTFKENCLRVLATGVAYHAVDEPITIRRSPEASLELTFWTWSLFRVSLPQEAGWGLMSVTIETTERKQAEQARQDSEADFETLANHVPQMVWMCKPDGSNFYFNQRWMTYTGLALEESYGTGWNTPFHPDHKQAAWDAWNHATEAGEKYSIESRLRGSDGGYRWFLIVGEPLKDSDGNVVRWFGTCTDIQELKRAEEELRQSVARERARAIELEALMNAVPGAIFFAHDPEGRYIYGNRATCNLLRRQPGDNLSVSAPEAERPATFRVMRNGSEIPAYELPVQKAALTGLPVENSEINLVFEDGSSVTWFGGAAPILDEDGRSCGAIGVFVDITERKRAEQALRDSEERLRLAQEAAGIGHFDWNLVTGEMTWSDSLKRMVSATPASTLDLWDKIRRIHPDDQSAFHAQLKSALDGESPKVSISYRSTTAAGTACWRLCEARVQHDEDGRPVRMLGVIADITSHKVAEQAQQIEQRRKHLEAGIQTLTDGVIIADTTGKLLSINPAALQLFGFDSTAAVPRDFAGFTALFEVTQLDWLPLPVDQWPIARALRGETVNASEFRCRNRQTGHTWTASYGCAPVLDETGAIILVVLGIHDTTMQRSVTEELQRTNAALHALSGQLLRLQDEERKRIARELHDGTLQMITAISMNLLMIARSPNVVGEVETQGLIVEAQELAKRCSRELRTVSYLLHPPDLEQLGLVAALRSWTDGFAHRTGIVLDVNLDDPGRLLPDVETALFRIAQEALANVQRHSGSSKASVRLLVSQQELRLEVSDEGSGVPRDIVERAPEPLGVGVLGMRERARQLGGTLEIFTQEPGTRVRAILPRGPG